MKALLGVAINVGLHPMPTITDYLSQHEWIKKCYYGCVAKEWLSALILEPAFCTCKIRTNEKVRHNKSNNGLNQVKLHPPSATSIFYNNSQYSVEWKFLLGKWGKGMCFHSETMKNCSSKDGKTFGYNDQYFAHREQKWGDESVFNP
jgi:hypothetical protein